jgi:hypothetical protein
MARSQDASQAYAALTADLQVEVYQNLLFKHIFVAGCQITVPDVRASNGVLHVIDCALLPPPPQVLPSLRSVGQLIRERFELSILEQALAGTGLLNAIDAATPTAPVTVFAPSNAGFIRFAASSPGFFISDATGRAVNPGVPGLRDVLKYGLVVGRCGYLPACMTWLQLARAERLRGACVALFAQLYVRRAVDAGLAAGQRAGGVAVRQPHSRRVPQLPVRQRLPRARRGPDGVQRRRAHPGVRAAAEFPAAMTERRRVAGCE